MTPTQLEAAARELCRLRGEDPDAQAWQRNKPGPDGVVLDTLYFCPAWMNARAEIEAAHQVEQAIAAGRAVRELVSLEEHGKRVTAARHALESSPRYNGIACPQCGKELVDGRTGYSNSFQSWLDTHCPACGWAGSRFT